ncbi:hypothetical protein NSB24_11305 [Blautia coccoides]|nr:hypothetical protein [Blautia coccoides]MCR1986795.1 hypothetical protein [Blautia coccoides]
MNSTLRHITTTACYCGFKLIHHYIKNGTHTIYSWYERINN